MPVLGVLPALPVLPVTRLRKVYLFIASVSEPSFSWLGAQVFSLDILVCPVSVHLSVPRVHEL